MKKLLPSLLLPAFLLTACGGSDLSDRIIVDEPQTNADGGCPLHIEGQARGTWYFEGNFSVELLDDEGHSIANSIAFADGEWMTEEFVPFSLDLSYETKASHGTLILENSNPSDLDENHFQLEIPVNLTACTNDEMPN